MSATIGKDEKVVLQVGNVKNRKGGDGRLYILSNRILWISADGDSSSSVSHKFDEIKVQKISPDGKAKIQLQICLNNGDSTTFQFVAPEGQQKQFQDRESVKDVIQQLLFQFKMKLDGDLEKKQKILQENREMFNIYKELVTTNVITADEFWKNYAGDKLNSVAENNVQKVGISPGFLSDVTSVDGCNGIKLNLTSDIIESIFRTYPSVKKKHFELVPNEMTEKEFWTQFFQSQYFHRDRSSSSHGATPQELFSDCLKLDDEDLKNQANSISFRKRTLNDAEEDFGLATGVDPDADDRGKGRNPVNVALMRKFNYRSSRLLQACLGDDVACSSSSNATSASLGSLLPTTSNDYNNGSLSKKSKITVECEELLASEKAENLALKLSHVEKYQNSSVDTNADNAINKIHNFSEKDVVRWRSKLTKCLQNWKQQSNVQHYNDLIDSGTAYAVLLDISSGGSLVPSEFNALQNLVPKAVLEEIRTLYLALNELLRHFWCCFPTTTPDLEQKLVRMYETLKRFDETKLKHWGDKLNGHCSLSTLNLIGHLQTMLNVAYAKYDAWSQKRQNVDQKLL